jgi:hypothetical protein
VHATAPRSLSLSDFVPFYCVSRFLIIAYSILEIWSKDEYKSVFDSFGISPSSYKKLIIDAHSNAEPLAVVKKFRLSLALNLALPSAILSMTLKLARPNWFLA